MDGIDLIGLVRPAGGWYALVAVRRKRQTRQLFYETRDELDAAIAKFAADRWCTFFGLARYKIRDNRTQENAEALQSFWVDIDCGPGKSELDSDTKRPKGYESQADGLAALREFCVKTNLPRPLLVNSGNGIHAYWPLNKEVPAAEWDFIAKKLRAACIEHQFYVDTNVFETARVLRPLGTFNFKGDLTGEPEKPVTLISEAGPFDIAVIRDAFGVQEGQTDGLFGQPRRERKLTALGAALAANVDSSFAKIMQRTANGDGCQQLGDCYLNRATLSEPRWFDALSIAKFCSDRDTAIHKMSEGHPDYEFNAVERKTLGIKGPHTCSEIENNNPGKCDGCPHKGKIKSPIVLGKIIARSTGVVTVEEPVADDGGASHVKHMIPEFPFPYFRGKNGGIYMPQEGEEAEPILIYENDLYVVKRLNDQILGDMLVLRLHLPKDGMKEFCISNEKLVDKRELCKALAREGVVCGEKKFVYLSSYLHASVKALQERERVEKMRSQFGWAENDSKFILGDKEVTASGTYFSPPSSTTKEIASHIHIKGDLEKWKEVFELYNQPGMEPHAFAALTAFGAPLFKFLGHKGVLINLINNKSGTGKSTVLYMCNSVYGSPVELASTWQDTLAAKLHKLGVMNNLPYTLDEMTNMEVKDFSNMAYSISQGRGKDRMKQSTNEMRTNLSSWATMALGSSNAAMVERMAGSKNNPEGEMMRLMEYPIDNNGVIPVDTAKQMFDHQLRENYGHAGDIYIKWLVPNKEEAVTSALEIQAKVDKEAKLMQRERFWSAAIAANLTGGLIAKKLGLINWDLMNIYLWAVGTLLPILRESCATPSSDVSAIIGDYIYRHIQNVLIVDGEIDRRTNKFSVPSVEPKGSLLIRYEPDTKKMFLMAKAFKEDCVKVQINYKDTIKQLKTKGILVDSGVKRLAKGMRLDSPGVHALVLDCGHPEFSSIDSFLPDTKGTQADAGGEG